MTAFRGTYTVLITPLTADGKHVDVPALKKLVKAAIAYNQAKAKKAPAASRKAAAKTAAKAGKTSSKTVARTATKKAVKKVAKTKA